MIYALVFLAGWTLSSATFALMNWLTARVDNERLEKKMKENRKKAADGIFIGVLVYEDQALDPDLITFRPHTDTLALNSEDFARFCRVRARAENRTN